MEAVTGLSVVVIILIVLFLIIFLYFVPLGLYITALASNVRVKIFRDLIGMRLRKVPPVTIVRSMITATKAGCRTG